MSKTPQSLNEGYKPNQIFTNDGVKRGYQPIPNINFGYQPSNKTSTPPTPPPSSSGSNAILPKNENN